MKKLFEFFMNLDIMVFIIDMDSYEIIYANKKGMKDYNFHSPEEVVGRKCYEALQGLHEPCKMCTNHKLREGYFRDGQGYNRYLNKYSELKETMITEDGRRIRVEFVMDLDEENIRRKAIQDMEAIANEGFRLALKEPVPDMSINTFLEYVGRALKAERTYIFEKNEKGNDDNTYEWAAEGVTPQINNLQDLPAEVCANWYNMFSVKKNVLIEDLEDIKEEDPLQYENLKAQDIHSLAVVPLFDNDTVIGFYGVDNPPIELLEYTSDMLEIMGHFIVSSIRRRKLMKRLEEMSHNDPLTGLGNRYALDEQKERTDFNESHGVIFCDVTGLKHVNDTEGHMAGDRLILRACKCLKHVFGKEKLFRTGGDELLVLCTGITEEWMKDKVEELRREMTASHVNIAVGMAWQATQIKTIRELIKSAEILMYEDKAEYYKTAGIERRK